MSDLSKCVLPWRREEDGKSVGNIKYQYGRTNSGLFSCWCIDGINPDEYTYISSDTSLEAMQKALDSLLINRGYRLLTQEEANKLMVLL